MTQPRTSPSDGGDLLRARLEWEAANPRPPVLRRAERAIVRGLKAEGLGPQYQVTRDDGFEIAVGEGQAGPGVLIHVEFLPSEDADA